MPQKISFNSIIDTIVDKNSITKVLARSLVKELALIIQQGLLRDRVVNLSGLGIFKLHDIAERPGRNIRTGETITIPAHRKVLFKPEKHLRELINKKYQDIKPQILDSLKSKKKEEETKSQDNEASEFENYLKRINHFEDHDKKVPEEEQKPKTDAKSKTPEKPVPVLVLRNEPEEPKNIFQEAAEKPATTKDAHNRDHREVNKSYIVYSIIAVLIIIFLFVIFSGEEEKTNQVVDQSKQPAVEKVVETPKNTPPKVSEESNAEKHSTVRGDNLWNLAYKYYKDGYMWPLIFEANKSIISNPDLLEKGIQLNIPVVKGEKPVKQLARGHILAYLAYKEKDNKSALNHLFVANKYDPDYVKSSVAKIDDSDLRSIRNLTMK